MTDDQHDNMRDGIGDAIIKAIDELCAATDIEHISAGDLMDSDAYLRAFDDLTFYVRQIVERLQEN